MTDAFDGLLSSLWRASWQGALALVFALLLCRVFARRLSADAHCWLWRLSYAKLLVGLLWGGAVLLPLLAPSPPPAPVTQTGVAYAAHQPDTAAKTAAGTGGAAPTTAAQARPRMAWETDVAALYLLGMAVCLGRLLLAARRARRALRSADPLVTGPEAATLAALARSTGLRRPPPLARSAAVDGPVFLGGSVLFPAEAHYPEAELRMILAHELAHVRRRDLYWEWLGTLVQVLFFFHPLVVLARREERLAREAAADALALAATGSAAADYGRMLLAFALERNRPRPPLLGAVGVIEGGTLLRRRLLALRGATPRRDGRRIAVVLVLLATLVIVPWQVTRGNAQAPGTPSAQTTSTLPAPAATDFPTMPAGDKSVTGIVVNEKGVPVAGVGVGLTWHWSQRQTTGEMMAGSSIVGRVSTDAQGRFTFPRLPAGDFDYGVYSPTDQYVPVRAKFRIGKADAQKSLRIVASTGSLVTGRVVDGKTGSPVAGVYVGAGTIPPGGDLSKWNYWGMPFLGKTDSQGHYQVRVTPGDVFVGVGRIDDGRASNRRVQGAARRVSVQVGQTATAPDISASLKPIIIFVGPDGQPVANATVRITAADMTKGAYITEDQTDATGTFVLGRGGSGTSGKSGTFSVAQDGRTASGTFHSFPDGQIVINIDGQTSTYPSGVATVRLAEGSAAVVTGSVLTEGGEPIPGALVRVTETDPSGGYGLGDQVFRTDATGVFRMPLDPHGRYNAYVRADGFNQVSVSDKPLAVAKGETTSLGAIHLVRADGSVSGRIVDRVGKPMSGVLAYVRGGKTYLSAAVTDDRGYFRIPNVVTVEALRLELCLHGEARDSGEALSQSNEEMVIGRVSASPVVRQIVWRPGEDR